MNKGVRLSHRALRELQDIADWTFEQFGMAQAGRYQTMLEQRIGALAAGQLAGRSFALQTQNPAHGAVQYVRAGQHLIVYHDRPDTIFILALPHARRDLANLIFPTDPNEA